MAEERKNNGWIISATLFIIALAILLVGSNNELVLVTDNISIEINTTININETNNSSLSGISEIEDNNTLFESHNLQSSNFNPIFHS